MILHILTWVGIVAGSLLLTGVVLFLMSIAASALETLFWWAGWSQRANVNLLPGPSDLPHDMPEADSYLVYLSGAGTMDPARMDNKEVEFLTQMHTRLPGSAILSDIFPYSPTNNTLVGDRRLAPFYSYVLAARKTRKRNIPQRLGIHFAQFRNVLQVGVSGDLRYGPYYNFGIAQVIVASLLRHGYRIGSARPVIMVVISGSGQISAGCAPMLKQMIRRPVWIVSVGSILTAEPGILDVEHVYHLSGSKDFTQHLGKILWRHSWPIFPNSAPHLFRRQGRLTVVDVGPMKHMQRGDYMSRSVRLPNGQRHVDKTADVVAEFVHRIEAEAKDAVGPAPWPALSEAGARLREAGIPAPLWQRSEPNDQAGA